MFKEIYLLLLLSQVALIKTQLTDNLKCNITDSGCMVRTAQKLLPYFTAGIKDLDISSLDVMRIDKMKIEFSGLKLNLKHVEVTGLKNAVIENIKWNTQEKRLDVEYRTDIFVRGQYKASGKLLILPISGEGDMTMEAKNHYVRLHMPYEIENKKHGKSYIKFKGHEYDFGVDGIIRFEFKNLFNGNKELSDALHKFMNENWKEVAETFGKPTLNKPISKIFKAIKKYFKSQPFENIVLSN